MDSLTQIVLGAAVGEAALGRKVGNKALLWGAIAGTIPDLDVIYIKLIGGNAIDEIVLHRGISHSITFAILMAPLLGWVINWLYRKKGEADFKGWSLLFFWSIFTHPLLDCLTTYGTQLFLPFSDYRVSIATVFVVDLFYTVPFLLSVIAVSLINRSNGWRRRVNYFGLTLSSAYLLAGFVNKQVVTTVFENDLHNEPGKPELRFVGTTPLNIILWYGVTETDSAFQIGYYSFFDETKDISWVSFEKNHHLIKDMEDEYGVNRLKWFSDNLYIVTQPAPEQINFYTLKFGRSKFDSETPDGSFAFYTRILIDRQNHTQYDVVREMKANELDSAILQLRRRILGQSRLTIGNNRGATY